MTTVENKAAQGSLADGTIWQQVADSIAGLKTWVWDDPRVTDDLTRAEGLRYLTRVIAGGITLAMEAWDADYPQLIKFLSPTLQYGLPAADCSYYWAAVHGDGVYRISGTRGSSRLFDVETRTGHTARIGAWKLVDRRSDFEVGDDGAIEIVLSRDEQPGNWIRLPEGPSSIIIRQYYYDWLAEIPAFLNLHRDGVPYPAPPLTPERVIEGAEILRDWLTQLPAACAAAVGTHYTAPADSLAFGALDFGWKDLQYGKGTYRCGPDEAVLIEFTPPDAPYWNVQLCSHFWEARDYHLRQSSINGHQAAVDTDGVFRAVIAQRDPGVANWLDAGGQETGLIAARYFRAPEDFDTPRIRTVALADLDVHLPPSTARITRRSGARCCGRGPGRSAGETVTDAGSLSGRHRAGAVVVYGANGATGTRLVELAVSAGLRPIVAGRQVEALRPLAERYGLEMRIGTLEPTELDRVVDGTRVLVSCVAPYTIHGRPLVDAALRHGTHYVDCTGEPRYVEQLIRADRAAREAGCALIPSAGLGLVANLVARSAAARVERVDRLTVDYKITGMRPSWGTANSTVHLLAGGAPTVRRGKVSYRLPGSRLRRLPDGLGVLFPLTDTLTLAWQWPDAEVSSYMRSRVAPLLCAGLALGSTAARRRVVHSMVERAAGRFRDHGTPHGHFVVTVSASQFGRTPAVARARLDNVYELTSQAVLEIVLSLLADDRHTGFCASGQVVGEPAEVAKRIGVDLDDADL